MNNSTEAPFDFKTLLLQWQAPKLGIVAVILMVVLSVTAKERSIVTEFEAPKLFERFEDIDEIRLSKFGQDIVMKKDGQQWKITSSHNYAADSNYIDDFLKALQKLEVKRPVTQNSEKFQNFQVHDKGFRVTLTGGGKERGSLMLGRAGIDPETLFVRQPESKQVYTAGPNSPAFQRQNATAWMVKELLPKLPTTKLRQLEFTRRGKNELTLLRDAGLEDKPVGVGWRIIKPIQHPARESSITRLIQQVAELSLTQAALPDAPVAQTGLNNPVVEIKLSMSDGQSESLKFGLVQANMAFVSSSMRQGIFKVPGYLLDRIIPKAESLRENDVVTFNLADVRKLEIVKPKSRCLVERGSPSSPWAMVLPDKGDCDGRAVNKVLKFASSLRFIKRSPSADASKFGLDTPLLVLTVTEQSGKIQSIRFGKILKTVEDEKKEVVYISKKGEKDLYLVDAAAFKKLKSEPRDFRGSLFNFGASNVVLLQRVKRLTGNRGLPTYIRKQGPVWQGTRNGNIWHILESKKVNELVKAISQFKRGQLAPQQDPNAYNIRQPMMTWAIQLKNNARHLLNIGKQLPNGKYPVTNERLRPIYLVNAEDIKILESRLNEDLRNRKLFDLTFADIHLNEIVITHVNKEKISLSRRNDGSWIIANPQSPADTAKVKELVKNLNALRASAIRFTTSSPGDQAERSSLIEKRQYEIRLLYRNMVNATIFVGPKRNDGTRMVAKPVGGAVDAAFEVKEDEIKKVLISLSDLKTGQFIGPIANSASAIDILPTGKPERHFLRKNNKWVQRNGTNRVDQGALRGVISQMVNMKPLEGVKIKPDHGLNAPLGQFVLTTPNRVFTILIGKPGPKPGTRHIKFKGESKIYVVRSYVFEQMMTSNPDYVDLKLITDYYTTFTKVSWKLPSGNIVIRKNKMGNTWSVTEPKIAKTDSVAVSQHLSMLGNMRGLNLEVSAAAIKSATLTNPEYSVVIERANKKPLEIKFSKAVEAHRRVVMTSDRKKALFVPQSTLNYTLPDIKKLTDLNIFECDINKIEEFTVQLPKSPPRTFKVSGGTWFDKKSQELVDRYVIVRLTSAFRKLRRDGPIPAADRAKVDFSKPLVTMSIKIGNEVNTLTVAKLDKNKRIAYLKFNNGEGFISSINSFYSTENLTNRSFENLQIAAFNTANIKTMTFKKGGQTMTLTRARNSWTLNPGNTKLTPTEVSGLVGTLRQLRADAIPATHDSKKEGFQPTHGELTVEASDKVIKVEFAANKNNEQMVRASKKLYIFRHGRLTALLSACERHLATAQKSVKKSPEKKESKPSNPKNDKDPKKAGTTPKKNG